MLEFLWRRTHRRGNVTEVSDSVDGSHIATVRPSESELMVGRFNATLAELDSKREQLDHALATLRRRNECLTAIREYMRPYVRDSVLAKRVMEMAGTGLK